MGIFGNKKPEQAPAKEMTFEDTISTIQGFVDLVESLTQVYGTNVHHWNMVAMMTFTAGMEAIQQQQNGDGN